jgi:excisionase family DNA binding protein
VYNFRGETGARSTVAHVADYLDLEAVAELLGVDRGAVYLLVRTGELPAVKAGSGWRVYREDALRFKRSQ